jgi:hypothetical protein
MRGKGSMVSACGRKHRGEPMSNDLEMVSRKSTETGAGCKE